MSFAKANQEVQRFVNNVRYAYPFFENIRAVMDARLLNTRMIDTATEERAMNGGKKRYIKISYYPVNQSVIADACDQNICATGAKVEPVQDWFLLNRCIATKPQTLDVTDLRLVDGEWTISEHAMMQIAATMGEMRKDLSQQLDVLITANAGLHLDGNVTKRITMSNTITGQITPLGLWEINKDFSDGGYVNPFIVGSTEVYNFIQAKGIAAENNTTGQDYRRVNQGNLYYDVSLNNVMSDLTNGEWVYAFTPEALKFVSFSENAGMFATNWKSPADFDAMFKQGSRNRVWGAFLDPDYGILWDFNAYFNECDGKNGSITWNMQLLWDIFFTPVPSGNPVSTNGIFLYRTCPVKIPSCPTGDTPSPAAVTRAFNWVPTGSGISYPFTLSSFVLNGSSVRGLATTITNASDLASAFNAGLGVNIFTASGGAVTYTGYSAMAGNVNDTVTVTFA